MTSPTPDKFDKLVKSIMKEAEEDGEPVTKEEAIEMAKMELGAKEIKNYVVSDKPRETKPREKKIDAEKAEIISLLNNCLLEHGYSSTISNIDKTIDFGTFTVTLTKHRPPKGKTP